MAYDPNDPADKAIFDAAIVEALEGAETAHEAEIERMKAKNAELLGKLAKARKGDGAVDTTEIERLEREIEDLGGKLTTSQAEARETKRLLTTAEKERDTAKTGLAKETEISRNMVADSSLTSSLVEANVAPQFLEAAKALLGKNVTVKEADGERKAFVGDKSLGEFVKEWATGDAGKPFIQAPGNAGGGTTPPGSPPSGSKKIYQMTDMERTAAYNANPADFDARVAAGENKAPAT